MLKGALIVCLVVFAVAPFALIAGLSRHTRKAFRRERGQCLRCGYPRAGLESAAACPECGDRPVGDPYSTWRVRRKPRAMPMLLCALGAPGPLACALAILPATQPTMGWLALGIMEGLPLRMWLFMFIMHALGVCLPIIGLHFALRRLAPRLSVALQVVAAIGLLVNAFFGVRNMMMYVAMQT